MKPCPAEKSCWKCPKEKDCSWLQAQLSWNTMPKGEAMQDLRTMTYNKDRIKW
ncbi:MAG: hypothetical protein KAS30_01705 [Candidatus Diapherotrites archaeon]|nr:hypothetical protein [Candidatus Diapherotrites archaeon]